MEINIVLPDNNSEWQHTVYIERREAAPVSCPVEDHRGFLSHEECSPSVTQKMKTIEKMMW